MIFQQVSKGRAAVVWLAMRNCSAMQRDADATFMVVGQTYASKHEDDEIREKAMGRAVARSGEMKMF